MTAVTVASRIDRVIVYRTGARVTRVAEISAEGGWCAKEVRISNLPLPMDDASVRVRVESDDVGLIVPTATDFKIALEVGNEDRSLPSADDAEILAVRKEEARLQDRLKTLSEMIGRLERLEMPTRPKGSRTEGPPASPTGSRLELLDFRRAQLEQLGDGRRQLESELQGIRRKLSDLRATKELASSARQVREQELRKTVLVSFAGQAGDAEVAHRARLVLEYHIDGARWTPCYRIHFNQELTRAQVLIRALVAQRTGEDWGNVRLTLSTANDLQWTERPELQSLRIGRRQPPITRTGWRAPPSGTETLYADFDRCFGQSRDTMQKANGGVMLEQFIGAAKQMSAEVPEADTLGQAMSQELAAAADDEAAAAPVAPTAEAPGKPCLHRSLARSRRPRVHIQYGVTAEEVGKADAAHEGSPHQQFEDVDGNLHFVGAQSRHFAGQRPPPASSTIIADRRQLDYLNLRMPPLADSRRGRLQIADRRDQYLRILTETQVSITFDVLQVIQMATLAAQGVTTLPMPDHHNQPTSVDGFDYAYEAQEPIQLASDGEFHLIPLAACETDATLRYVVVPRLERDVFRFAELDNPLAAPLLHGPADVYVGDDYLATTPLRTVPPHGRIRLGMGVEQAIKVARNTQFDEKATGLVGTGQDCNHEIEIEVANHLQRAASIEVRERIPVVRDGDEQLRVTVNQVEPEWVSYEETELAAEGLDGGYVWRIEIEAGEKQTVSVAYTIHLPSKYMLVDGNRRE